MDMIKQAGEKIRWARKYMSVMREIEERFEAEKLFQDKKIGLCLHITPETAFLAQILEKAGAKVYLTAANPLSTQPDIVSYLKEETGIKVLGFRGMTEQDHFENLQKIISWEPDLLLDDGAELIALAHEMNSKSVIGATEETATGYYKILKIDDESNLNFPVIATNFSFCHDLFDNKHGTSQSVIDGIIRATNALISGKTVVVAGYGQCGAVFAEKIRGMGANVIVCEVNPQRALEAAFSGFRILPMKEAAPEGDIFCTFTGNINVIKKEHLSLMKDNVILCNAGHYDIEIDKKALSELSVGMEKTRENITEYVMEDGKIINLIAEGRIVNMTAAEGHPAAVMDITFALQLLSLELFVIDDGTMQTAIYEVPEYIDENIANLKLESLGIHIDELDHEQLMYMENAIVD